MRKLIVIMLVALAGGLVAGCSSGSEGGGVAGTTGAGGEDASGGGVGRLQPIVGGVTTPKGGLAASRPVDASVPQLGPRIVQTASLRLSIRRGRFDETVDDARSIAAGLGGFVVSSSASQGAARRLVRGTLVIRVPATSYAEAMKSLAALGRVEGRQESGQDVSQTSRRACGNCRRWRLSCSSFSSERTASAPHLRCSSSSARSSSISSRPRAA
jgi:hypothetical protein